MSDDAPEVRLERFLPHAPERVWRALTDPEELPRWFLAPALGEIAECEPPRRLVATWEVHRLTFELIPEGDGTRLVLVHRYDPELGPGPQHAMGWRAYLARLEAVLNGGELEELAAHRQGDLVELDGRPAVRFVRRLRHPAERVWRAVSDPAEMGAWFPVGAERFAAETTTTAWEPPRRWAFTWGGDAITIEVAEVGDATLLTFTQVLGEGAGAAARNAAGWEVCLDALEARLADPGSPPVETGLTPGWRERYDAYRLRGLPAEAAIPGAA